MLAPQYLGHSRYNLALSKYLSQDLVSLTPPYPDKVLGMVGFLCAKATRDCSEVPGMLGGSRWQLRACIYGAGLREPTAPSGGSKRAQPGFSGALIASASSESAGLGLHVLGAIGYLLMWKG